MYNENVRQILKTMETDENAEAAVASAIQHEDVALKAAFQYFSDELLPYFGITKKLWRLLQQNWCTWM